MNIDFEPVIGSTVDAFARKLFKARPSWVRGSLSFDDAHFLFTSALQSNARVCVEIGTASGFSTSVLCHALNFASLAARPTHSFQISSYDIADFFYADPSRKVGDAAREILPPALMNHISFRHPASTVDLKRHQKPEEIELLFVDANHKHPWPTLDLYTAFPFLSPGASVILHDINLPLLHTEFPEWGAKHLFDRLDLEKATSLSPPLPNIGLVTIPEDKEDLRAQLVDILAADDWECDVDSDYLKLLGLTDTIRLTSTERDYLRMVRRVSELVEQELPQSSTILVVSKGDPRLLRFGKRHGWHFPQSLQGEYLGYHPPDAAFAIAHLEHLKAKGAQFLLVPQSAFWWFEYYEDLQTHLSTQHRLLFEDKATCKVFALI
jgi:hypothetical protein